jgi:hypothetical protein
MALSVRDAAVHAGLMDIVPSTRERTQVRRRRLVLGLVAAVIALATAAAVVVAAQVEVTAVATEREGGVTRTCGSVFDSIADRSGWETWWARDLDEVDPAVRAALVRTSACPGAINLRLAVGATLVGIAAMLAVALPALTDRRTRARVGSGVGARLGRLGRVTSCVGAALTVAGLAALVLLVADADSTLFLYADRLVVGVVGLIVLVPTVTLVVIGRALTILGGTDVGPVAAADTSSDAVGAETVDA